MPSIFKKRHHLQKAERFELAILLEKNYSIRSIARVLDRSPSAISDEINRHRVEGKYDPVIANELAQLKRKNSKYQGMKIVDNLELRTYVEEKIKEDWSPEQIAGRLKNVDWHLTYASHQIIYKFIRSPYAEAELAKHLRHYRKKKNEFIKVPKIEDRTFIDERPEIIKEKQRFYDWEGDFIVSGKQSKEVLLVLYERKSQLGIIRKLKTRSAQLVSQTFQELTGNRVFFNSLTVDNDMAFKKHQFLSKLIGAPIYFCHPYHFWEKGGVENFNKLIRQYIPKSSDIANFSDSYIKEVVNKLNNRPRKNLNYKTPLEVLKENNQVQLFQPIKYFDIINLNCHKQKTTGCSV